MAAPERSRTNPELWAGPIADRERQAELRAGPIANRERQADMAFRAPSRAAGSVGAAGPMPIATNHALGLQPSPYRRKQAQRELRCALVRRQRWPWATAHGGPVSDELRNRSSRRHGELSVSAMRLDALPIPRVDPWRSAAPRTRPLDPGRASESPRS